MSIRAIVFDIGGVLAITPNLGVRAKWEQKLGLASGEIDRRLHDVWRGGSIGTISEVEVNQQIGEIMGMDETAVISFMADIWQEYLGTLNEELAQFFQSLRPQYQTAILSNSFVGARERELARYHFDEMCDFIIYSHEVGMDKPNPRIYELTCQRLGLSPNEVIFLDNAEMCIEGADAVGMHGILFKDNAQAIADIKACIQTQKEQS